MRRSRRVLFVLPAIAGFASAVALAAGFPPNGDARPAWFEIQVTAVRLLDADTFEVRTTAGKRETVQLIGADAPEAPRCFATQATALARRLILRRVVRISGDRLQPKRDRQGRLLAYVAMLPGGQDLGSRLIREGYALSVRSARFARAAEYRAVEAKAASSGAGMWSKCSDLPLPPPTTTSTPTSTAPTTTSAPTTTAPTTTSPPTTTSARCDPSYPTVCIPPPPPDLDCKDIPYRNFRVLPPDPHRFDGNDKDGIGCET